MRVILPTVEQSRAIMQQNAPNLPGRYLQHVSVTFISPNTLFEPIVSTSHSPGTGVFAQASGRSPGRWTACTRRALIEGENGTKKRDREILEVWDSRKGTLLSLKCFFALSGCLTKAAGEFCWRIRLVAFLWLLTSGDFGSGLRISMK